MLEFGRMWMVRYRNQETYLDFETQSGRRFSSTKTKYQTEAMRNQMEAEERDLKVWKESVHWNNLFMETKEFC